MYLGNLSNFPQKQYCWRNSAALIASFQFCDHFHGKSTILLLTFKILNDLALNYLTVLSKKKKVFQDFPVAAL